MYKVLKMNLDCGRQGDIDFVAVADQEMITLMELFQRENPMLNAYGELGKHSDIDFNFNDINIIDHEITDEVASVLDAIGITTGFDFILEGASAMLRQVAPKIEEYLETKGIEDINFFKEPITTFNDMVGETGLDMGFDLTGEELRLIVTNGEY